MQPPTDSITFQKKLPLVLTGKLLPALFLLIITILYSRGLGYDDYGRFQSVWILSSIAGTLLCFGLPAIILATPSSLLKEYLRKHRSAIVAGYSLLLLTAMLFVWFSTAGFSNYLRSMVALFILLQTACIIAETRLIKNNDLWLFAIINAVYAAAFLGIHLYFLYHVFSLEKLVSCVAGLCALKLIVMLPVKNKRQLKEDSYSSTSFIKHWLYTGFNEVTGILARWLDKIFILFLLSPADFAIFYNGAFEIPLFAIVISAMENVMLANISENITNKKEAQNVFRESFKMLSLISFPVFFFFLFCHAEVYDFLFDGKYNSSVPVFLVSIFILPLRITHYGVILQCYGKANKLLFGSVMDIMISLALMFILYPVFHTKGVVLALVISTYLQVFYYLFQSARTIGMRIADLIPLAYLGRLFISLGLAYLLLSVWKTQLGPMLYLGILFSLSTLVVLTGMYWYFIRRRGKFRLQQGAG